MNTRICTEIDLGHHMKLRIILFNWLHSFKSSLQSTIPRTKETSIKIICINLILRILHYPATAGNSKQYDSSFYKYFFNATISKLVHYYFILFDVRQNKINSKNDEQTFPISFPLAVSRRFYHQFLYLLFSYGFNRYHMLIAAVHKYTCPHV